MWEDSLYKIQSREFTQVKVTQFLLGERVILLLLMCLVFLKSKGFEKLKRT